LHNQTLLGHESVIFHRQGTELVPAVLEKFLKYFAVYGYRDLTELNRLLERVKADRCYFIKSGERDGILASACPSAIHAVFPTRASEFHGNHFAFVSQWLSKEYANHRIPYVPHMIHLPSVEGDLRPELGLTPTQTVLGYYGGSDSFNLRFVHQTLLKALNQRSDLVFLFMNVSPFAQHERLLFLPGSAYPIHKVRFIQTCDAMIHARGIGESFGLACGEFSIKNKPVFTYAFSPQRSHIDILGPKAILYTGAQNLLEKLLAVDRAWQHQQSWDAYSEHFQAAAVMEKFKRVFLEAPAQPLPQISQWDTLMLARYRLARKIRNLKRKLYR
jgi:hypothetical protein